MKIPYTQYIMIYLLTQSFCVYALKSEQFCKKILWPAAQRAFQNRQQLLASILPTCPSISPEISRRAKFNLHSTQDTTLPAPRAIYEFLSRNHALFPGLDIRLDPREEGVHAYGLLPTGCRVVVGPPDKIFDAENQLLIAAKALKLRHGTHDAIALFLSFAASKPDNLAEIQQQLVEYLRAAHTLSLLHLIGYNHPSDETAHHLQRHLPPKIAQNKCFQESVFS